MSGDPMARVAFFIDGFNVYHSLKENPSYHRYLWLDYRTLAERFTRRADRLSEVHYFTAYATWKPHSMKRHRMLVGALESRAVNIVMGKFKKKDMYCKVCRASFKVREEKQTDVNIAVSLLKEALLDHYDTAVLLTNDTDLIPAIQAVKEAFPGKKIGVLFPIDRWATELKDVCDFWRKIERKDLARSQFPNEVRLPSGVVLTRPSTWT
jgi:uncharacterized LabA/DUF88 family protein